LCLHIHPKPIVTLWIPDATLAETVVAYFWHPGLTGESRPSAGAPEIVLTPVSQLRAQNALALSEAVSSETARIGLDRVEFVRKQFPR
jgi:hypothetical protein